MTAQGLRWQEGDPPRVPATQLLAPLDGLADHMTQRLLPEGLADHMSQRRLHDGHLDHMSQPRLPEGLADHMCRLVDAWLGGPVIAPAARQEEIDHLVKAEEAAAPVIVDENESERALELIGIFATPFSCQL